MQRLLGALVNLLQECAEDGTAEYGVAFRAWHLWHRVDERVNSLIRRRFVLRIHRVDTKLNEDVLDACLSLGVLPPIVGVEDRALCGIGTREGRVDAPRALVVHDVRANLADLLRRPGVVEEVILDLEVLAERDEDVQRNLVEVWICLVLLLGGEAAEEQCESDGEIEGVVSRLVDNNGAVPIGYRGSVRVSVDEGGVVGRKNSPGERELGQIYAVFWSGDQVNKLAHFRLI